VRFSKSLARRYGFTTHGAADRAEHVVPALAERLAHHEQRGRLYELEFRNAAWWGRANLTSSSQGTKNSNGPGARFQTSPERIVII
jgi:hypothetical protein